MFSVQVHKLLRDLPAVTGLVYCKAGFDVIPSET